MRVGAKKVLKNASFARRLEAAGAEPALLLARIKVTSWVRTLSGDRNYCRHPDDMSFSNSYPLAMLRGEQVRHAHRVFGTEGSSSD